MTLHDSFDDRRRGLEAEYFQKQEHELIEKLRQRYQLKEATGIADEELLRDLQELGYTRETLMLLYLMPLVQVAWVEGFTTENERRLILEAAGMRGIHEDSAAYKKLAQWLKHKPAEEVFDKTLRLIRTVLQALPAEEREHETKDIIASCLDIAKASHVFGIFHTGHISAEETQLLERIAAELNQKRASDRQE